MELTNEERQAVYNLRHEKERAMRPALEHLLNVAARYTAWLNKNGAGSTYSTFCDDFGYEAVDNEDRPELYKKVLAVRSAAANLL